MLSREYPWDWQLWKGGKVGEIELQGILDYSVNWSYGHSEAKTDGQSSPILG